MARNRPPYLFVLFLFFSVMLSAQPTILEPGDVIMLGVNTDTGPCGAHAESDEISFALMKNFGPFSRLHITDNGWETAFPNFWGDKEGVIELFRTGPVIPAGTVITLVCSNNGGVYSYNVISPDGEWFINNLDPSGGQFSLDSGGDQIYFMQNGTWNGSGGADMATYSGDILYGFTTTASWTSDGTIHQSNLHPQVSPCFNSSSYGAEYFKYTQNLTPTFQLDWWNRVKDAVNWTAFVDCNSYAATFPNYAGGFSIGITPTEIGISCHGCFGCPPYESSFELVLPPGYAFDIVYTDGTDEFTIENAMDGDMHNVTIEDTTTYSIVSITDPNGCPMNFDFTEEATFIAPKNNPGTHGELWICPDYGTIQLGPYLGPHDPGGQWFPPLDPITGNYYSSFWGPGVYHYVFVHPPPCPIDSASVTVYHIDTAGTTVDIGCDINGTPFDITDDRMVVTVFFNVTGPTFGTQYEAIPERFNVPYGTIEPSSTGQVGEVETFILSPGTATQTNMSLEIQGYIWPVCDWRIPLPPPGFCSDPCDHEMTATITGGGDICPNSCPDNPVEIEIDHDGGEEDYRADISITAPGFPTWTITDIELEGFAPTTITVCVGDVPQPVYDEGSRLLTLPKGLAGQDVSITLINVFAKYDCVAMIDESEVIVTIHSLPPITTTSFKVCKGESTTVDLTEFDFAISNFYDVHWYDEDPLQGGSEINGPSVVNLQNVVQLWAYIEDDYCGNSIQVPFMILPQPDLDSVPPIEVCNGLPVTFSNIVLTDAGMSSATYTFHDSLPPDTSNRFNTPFFIPTDTTTIYVLATALICYDTLPIVVNVQEYPDFTLEGLPCDLALNTYSIVFSSDADSIRANKGIVKNNPAGQDSIVGIPADSAVIIEILNPSGLCKDTFLITAPNCNCPFTPQPVAAQPAYSICEGLPNPILSVTVDPGLQVNWYDAPIGGNLLLQNSTTFQPVSSMSATYYAEAIDPATLCYSNRTSIPVSVHAVAQLQPLVDEVLCDMETLNFNTLAPPVLNGVAGSGQWYNLSNHQLVTGVVTPQNGDSWYYVFSSNPGLCESRDTIQAIVNELPFVDIYDIACDEASLTFDLLFTSNADVILTNAGTLVNTPGTDSFALENIPFNTNIHFDLEILATGCTATVDQLAPNCSCPDLLSATNSRACTDEGTVDLGSFIGPGANGNWQMVSTPAGSNPATLAGNILNIAGADPGVYNLRFIRNVILNNCVDTADFQFTLNESPYADAGSDMTVCAGDIIQLNGDAGGTNVQFTWTETGNGFVSNPNALSTTYQQLAADIFAGSVNFTLTAVDQSGFCPTVSETITVDIDNSTYFVLDPTTVTYCDTADIDVDFDDLVSTGTTAGYWFFPAGVPASVTNESHFNPTDLPAGNYTVYYTTNTAVPPCENDTVAVNLIIENCQCPSVALSTPVDALCSESGQQDLDDFLITSESGTWSIVGTPAGTKPATISGSNFITNNSDAGIYTIRFSLNNPVAGCPDEAEITLEVIATPTIQIGNIECSDDLTSWEVVIVTVAEDVSSSIGNLTSLGSNRYRIDNIDLLSNLQVTATNGNGLCAASVSVPAPDCDCSIAISNLPAEISLCPEDDYTLEPNYSGGKGNVTAFWIVADDSLYQNTLKVSQGGTYEFVTIDSLGCKDQQAVEVSIYTEMLPDISIVDVKCPGDADGEIFLNAIIGGNGPYFISLNGGNSQPISSFPYSIQNLAAGTYEIELTDAFSCIFSFEVTIHSASSESLSLGPDQTILVGDSAVINPVLSFVPDSFYWTGDISLLDVNMLNNVIRPDADQNISLFGIDENGCLYSDELFIRVLLTSGVYVPTIFSPNNDGINDILGPKGDPSVVSFDYFEVFSRWGEMVYGAYDFLPSDSKGWDGTFNGKQMQPGVFIYRYSATNKRGKTLTGYGDVTIMR